MYKKIKEKGISLVEVVIGTSIILAITVGFVSLCIAFIKSTSTSLYRTKATFLSEEAVEAVKTIRDSSWSTNIASLSTDTDYYLSFDKVKNIWSLSKTPTSFIDNTFERKVLISTVSRDGMGRIGIGASDSNTRLVTVSLSWFDKNMRATSTRYLKSYITNLFDN